MLTTSLSFHSVIREAISLNCNHQRYDFKPFGQAIKSTREKKGLTRKELAAQIRISPRYIASIQNSGQTPSLHVFYRLVTCLDMSVDQFLSRRRSSQRPPSGGNSTRSLTTSAKTACGSSPPFLKKSQIPNRKTP